MGSFGEKIIKVHSVRKSTELVKNKNF